MYRGNKKKVIFLVSSCVGDSDEVGLCCAVDVGMGQTVKIQRDNQEQDWLQQGMKEVEAAEDMTKVPAYPARRAGPGQGWTQRPGWLLLLYLALLWCVQLYTHLSDNLVNSS